MGVKTLKLAAMTILLTCALYVLLMSGRTSSDFTSELSNTGLGTVENLEANYKDWETRYVKEGGDRNVVSSMGWFKGLSTEHTYANGMIKLNMIDGIVSVEANGLSKDQMYDFWLVDSSAGNTILPESNDGYLLVGSLKHEGKVARLEANLGSEAFASFDPDLMIVTRAGKTPVEDRLLVGTTTLFHRLYRSQQRGEFGVLADREVTPATDDRNWFERLVDKVSPTAEAQVGPIPNPTTPMQILITQGRGLFNNATFSGNGRTCSTCHEEINNLTIDPAFIATLPPSDPLFVAEFNPALSSGFEDPLLMHQFGLILENVDGFNRPGVMRGVPHTLALIPTSLEPATGDGTTIPPNERTGWSGDGAPGTGTLREFAIGAVTQHFTKTLNRVPNVDFVLPTPSELDALEAFQRSTGRRADLVLTGPGALSLKVPSAAAGQALFVNDNVARCNLCHNNAGAGDLVLNLKNANFNTNVESLPASHPPGGPSRPIDAGFGTAANAQLGGFGNGSFNTPPLVEAADTPPFFHNNSVNTIEEAVAFYSGPEFNTAPGFGAVIPINLNATQNAQIGAFLRVINALENIRQAEDLINRARSMSTTNDPIFRELMRLAEAEIRDAIDVLAVILNSQHGAMTNLTPAEAYARIAATPNNQLAGHYAGLALVKVIAARGHLKN